MNDKVIDQGSYTDSVNQRASACSSAMEGSILSFLDPRLYDIVTEQQKQCISFGWR